MPPYEEYKRPTIARSNPKYPQAAKSQPKHKPMLLPKAVPMLKHQKYKPAQSEYPQAALESKPN